MKDTVLQDVAYLFVEQYEELAELHLESVDTVARLSRNNTCGVSDQIAAVCVKADFHLQHMREKLKKGRDGQLSSHNKESTSIYYCL